MISDQVATSTLQKLRDAFVDNPVFEKDTRLIFSKVLMLVGVILVSAMIMMILGPVLLASWADSHDRVRSVLLGPPLLMGLTIGALILQGVFLPMIASTTLSSERERGTLDLLTTSALSPGQIVAGKYRALLSTYAVYFFLFAPLFVLPAFAGEVNLTRIVSSVILIGVNGAVLLAGGLFCSAFASNTRVSAAFAFIFAGIVLWPLVVGPSIVLVALTPEPDFVPYPFFCLVVVTGFIVTAHGLVAARARVAPRATEQRRYRWLVTRAGLVAVPVMAALTPFILSTDALSRTDAEAWRHLITIPVAALLIFLVIAEVGLSGTRAHDAVTPRRSAVLTTLWASIGFLCAAPFLFFGMPFGPVINAAILVGGFLGGISFLAFCATVTAVIARHVSQPIVRALLAGFTVTLLCLLPVFLFVVAETLDISGTYVPLGFTNPMVVAANGAELLGERGAQFFDLDQRNYSIAGLPAVLLGPLFWMGLTALLFPFASKKKAS